MSEFMALIHQNLGEFIESRYIGFLNPRTALAGSELVAKLMSSVPVYLLTLGPDHRENMALIKRMFSQRPRS
ncbi:MAG: hypothetical protein ACTSPE_08765 [Candidatus Thorarchaeota archaeon]